jgi:hypothetical protein
MLWTSDSSLVDSSLQSTLAVFHSTLCRPEFRADILADRISDRFGPKNAPCVQRLRLQVWPVQALLFGIAVRPRHEPEGSKYEAAHKGQFSEITGHSL